MSDKYDGGPAFPDPGRAQSEKQREKLTETGMSLRDYFAAHAPGVPGWHEPKTWVERKIVDLGPNSEPLRYKEVDEVVHESMERQIARWRYEYADAMLAERGGFNG